MKKLQHISAQHGEFFHSHRYFDSEVSLSGYVVMVNPYRINSQFGVSWGLVCTDDVSNHLRRKLRLGLNFP
jgi:hypothetical protein